MMEKTHQTTNWELSPSKLQLMGHLAVFLGHVIFGAGTTVAQMGLGSVSPVVFAFIREGLSALCFLAAAATVSPRSAVPIGREDCCRLLAVGLSIFGANFFFIIGVKLAGSHSAAMWQPASPVIATAMAVAFGLEEPSQLRQVGIFLACTACVLYTVFDTQGSGIESASRVSALEGNLCFVFGSISASSVLLLQKPLLQKWSSLLVLGYGYIVAMLLMGVVCVLVHSTPPLSHFVCPDCTGDDLAVSPDAIFGIFYWVIFGSVIGYTCLSWGNKHLDVSIVTVYSAVQPVVATLTSCAVIAFTEFPHYHLRCVGMSDWACIGIFSGLGCCVYDSFKHCQSAKYKRLCAVEVEPEVQKFRAIV